MTMESPVVWMNVTSSRFWSRPAVGVIRVERALCAELRSLYGARLRLCEWRKDRFVEVDQEGFLDTKRKPVPPARAVAESPNDSSSKQGLPWIFPLLSPTQALYSVGQGVFSLCPAFARPALNRVFYALGPAISRMLMRGFWDWRKKPPPSLSTKKIQKPDVAIMESRKSEIFNRGDVLLSVGLDWDQPYYELFYYLRNDLGVRIATCCYDLIPVLFPQFCVGAVAEVFGSYFLEIADGSDLVFCISERSERDLNEFLDQSGGARPATAVFQLGDTLPETEGSAIAEEVSKLCDEAYILIVSTVERRKNHETVYRAVRRLCVEGHKGKLPKVVFVGMQGWGVDDFMSDIAMDPVTRELFVHLKHVSDSELDSLYRHCLFTVFPSFYEGWGLPVGEALSYGKPVLSSNGGALTEVGGDCVLYIDPLDTLAWAKEILRMALDVEWRSDWETRIKANYSQREWSHAGQQVFQAIERMITSSAKTATGSMTQVSTDAAVQPVSTTLEP